MNNHSLDMLNTIAQIIYDKKGRNILALDVREVSTLTEYMLIAEGTVERHVQALCSAIIEKMEGVAFPVFHLDGEKSGDWIVIDCGNILIHLFIPELREKYALETLWQKGTLVDLTLSMSDSAKEIQS